MNLDFFFFLIEKKKQLTVENYKSPYFQINEFWVVVFLRKNQISQLKKCNSVAKSLTSCYSWSDGSIEEDIVLDLPGPRHLECIAQHD